MRKPLHNIVVGISLWLLLVGTMLAVAFAPLSSDVEVIPPSENLTADQALVFFGYPGCHSVCPVVLRELDEAMNKLGPNQSRPQVVFVNLSEDSSELASVQYAQAFNPDFMGVMPSPEFLKALKSQYGLNYTAYGTEIQHQGRTYLIEKRDSDWFLTKSYQANAGLADLILNDMGDAATIPQTAFATQTPQ